MQTLPDPVGFSMALSVNVFLLILQVHSLPACTPLGPLYSAIKHTLNKAKSNVGLVPTNKLLGDFFVDWSHWNFVAIELGYIIKYRNNIIN